MAAKLDTDHIHNAGEFYSQHYLDAVLADDLAAVLERWNARESDGGPKAPPRRLAALTEPYFKALANFQAEADPERRRRICADFHASVLDALGYTRDPSPIALPGGATVPRAVALALHGKPYLWIIEAPFPASEDNADPLGARPLDLEAETSDAADPAPTWRELLDGPLLRQEHPPRWVLLLAGPDVFLIDRDKWPLGQYLHFELGAMLGHRRPTALRAAAALLHREVLLPESGQSLLDQLDEKSHKHAFAVSTDLKLGVQRAIERIGDEAVWYLREKLHQKVFDRPELAGQLARECITYLYRLLFLFYVEARGGEVGVVPMKADAYREGLSLESLRDLELVPLTTDRARNGYYIHHSLEKLFEVVHLGWPRQSRRQRAIEAQYDAAVDLVVDPQRSPLFDRARTPILSSVKLRNHVLQEVIALLSLSKEGSRSAGHRQRGRISYAQLGINQLGAVYEGLLAYTGFFAQEDTFEVQAEADQGDARVFYVPRSRAGDFEDTEFRKTASGAKIVHPKGSFLFRLAGRDREKSASYYTPEVLTRCLTKYTLKERLGEPGKDGALTADEILELTICEPAMGSGAFLNEAVTQLAHAYLERKQVERGEILASEDYQRELARVKYHFVNHRCYGVDQNPLAAELGKVSLWLGVLQSGVQAPFLDLRVRVGNSLIGARREVYAAADLMVKSSKKTGVQSWLDKAPRRLAAGEKRPKGSIYHFLLPDAGMAPYEGDKVVKALCEKEIAALKAWRKAITQPFTPMEVARLEKICEAIDALWEEHRRVRVLVLEQTRQPIAIWGQPGPGPGSGAGEREALSRWKSVEECEPIGRELYKAGSPGRRLKAVMDYWCGMWSWPVLRVKELPTREAWLSRVEELLERGPGEEFVVAEEGRFLHWELEFPEVFLEKGWGGFDVILGNPPWIKLEWEEAGILGDLEPLFAVRKLSAKSVADRRARALRKPDAKSSYLSEFARSIGDQAFLNASSNYPTLQGMQTNLYKSFICKGASLACPPGALGFIHQRGMYDDPKGGPIRKFLHRRLRLHAHLMNKLFLFPDIIDKIHFELSIFRGAEQASPQITNIVNLCHPSTLDGSFEHDGIGAPPAIKSETGHWDLRPHGSRLVHVDEQALTLFARLYDAPGTPASEARLPVVHNKEILSVLRRFADAPRRISDVDRDYFCTEHFHETNQQHDGTIRRETHLPSSPVEWIVSGPHIYVGTPLYKTPNESCKHNQDYSPIDLARLPDSYLPRTNYVPACDSSEYLNRTPHWHGSPVTDSFRWMARKMIPPTNERTLAAAILPPHVAHIDGVFSAVFQDEVTLLDAAGGAASIVADFFVKSTGKSNFRDDILRQLPLPTGPAVHPIRHRTLLLNCLTTHYADLWNRNLPPKKQLLPSAKSADPRCAGWDKAPRAWCWEAPLRTPYARRQALVELDALAALSLGMTLDELLLIYRVQFPVLQQYERETYYDRRGKIVFTVNKGLAGVGLDRKQWEQVKHAKAGDPLPEWAHDQGGPFQPPFDKCDREEDMSQAYHYFKERLGL